MNKTIRFALIVMMLALVAVLSVGGVAAQDSVVIHWWHESTNADQVGYWQGLADAYSAAHPGVTFEITNLENEAYKAKLATVMQAGDPPDLFWSWGGGVLWNFAAAGLVRDITPEMTANNNEWKDSFSATAALDLYGKDGKQYGAPFDWGAVGMFYNKALFIKAGLDPAKPPTTWTELLDAVKTLKAAGITPISIGEKDKWPGHFWYGYLATREAGQAGFLAAYNRTGSFTDAPFVKAFEDLKQLVDLNAFQEGFLAATYGDEETTFGNADAAMELMGQWSPGSSKSGSASGLGIGEDMGWFPFPMVEGGAGNANDVFGGGDGFAVGKNAPDAAVDFLKFLTSAENQIAGAQDPINLTKPPVVKGTDSVIATDPILTAIVNARNNAPYFQLYYDQFLPPAVAGQILDSVEGIMAGAMTPQEAAQAIEDTAATELSAS